MRDDDAFCVFDIEAHQWCKFRLAVRLSEFGDLEVYRSADALRNGLMRGAERHAFAHYGGRYDFQFLRPLQAVAYAGSDVTRAQLGRVHLHDSARLYPETSVKKLGLAVSLPKRERFSDRIEELSDAEVEDGCIRDCEIVAVNLKQHRAWLQAVRHPSPRWTTGSGATAVYLLEALEPDAVRHLSQRSVLLDPEAWLDHHAAVTGPRSECWQVGYVDCVYCYDIRSSYPRSWLEAPMPVGPWEPVTHEVPGLPGVYYCNRIRQERSVLPIAPVGHAWRYDGAGWLTAETIAAVRLSGGDVEVNHGWVSHQTMPLGDAFVRYLYPLKRAGRPYAKAALNALHGKFSQGLTFETYFHTRQGYVRDEELRLPQWYQQPLIVAHVFARAALRLAQTAAQLQRAGWRVYYAHTDSLHTNCPPDKFPAQQGDNCGDWRIVEEEAFTIGADNRPEPCVLRGEQVEAIYLGPGQYALRDDRGAVRVVCAGVSRKQVTWQHMERAADGEEVQLEYDEGLTGYRESMHGLGEPSVQHHSKTLCKSLCGKVELEDGQLVYPD